MTIKKCRDCGTMYETKDRFITLTINHKDIEALEDVLFCENTKEEFKRMRPKLNKIWKQICDGEKKWMDAKPSKTGDKDGN